MTLLHLKCICDVARTYPSEWETGSMCEDVILVFISFVLWNSRNRHQNDLLVSTLNSSPLESIHIKLFATWVYKLFYFYMTHDKEECWNQTISWTHKETLHISASSQVSYGMSTSSMLHKTATANVLRMVDYLQFTSQSVLYATVSTYTE